MEIEIIEVKTEADWDELVGMILHYAQDPMGLDEPMTEEKSKALRVALPQVANGAGLIAKLDGRVVGGIIGFFGFSTFQVKPIFNVHDAVVLREYRGKGIGRRMLEAALEMARGRDCCRVSLEVRSDNPRAKGLYESLGFRTGGDGYDMYFMERNL